jgi:hypothetical protein
MKIYLLVLAAALACSTLGQNCMQVGGSDLGKLASCKLISPPPQLQWSINVTLQKDYNWLGPEDIKYAYLTIDDQPIDETCYPGQTIKGKYNKGTNLLIEHLCFNFRPQISKGDKLYLLIFSSQDSGSSQVIYLTFTGTGLWEQREPTEEDKANAIKHATKILLVQEE